MFFVIAKPAAWPRFNRDALPCARNERLDHGVLFH